MLILAAPLMHATVRMFLNCFIVIFLATVNWGGQPATPTTQPKQEQADICPAIFPPSAAGAGACYLPAHIARAEQQLSVLPIRPVQTVQKIARLSLVYVETMRATGVVLTNQPFPPVIGVSYTFLTLPLPKGQMSYFCGTVSATCPPYVIVSEFTDWPMRGSRMIRNGSCRAPREPCGPWEFAADVVVHKHHLTVQVTANAPRDVVRAIGMTLVQLARPK